MSSAQLGLEKAGVKKQVTPENAKEVIEHLSGNELETVKKIIIDSYEVNISAVLLQVAEKSKK